MVLSLSAKGLTHGEISAHLEEIYGAKVSKETVTRITDGVLETMVEWQNRPLDAVYPVVFIDAIHVKIREGQVANRPIYVAIGVTVDGERDILGLWAGDGGEGAKYWAHVLTEIKNRGTKDVCILVCDGLTGLPDAVASVWPQTIVQACVVHLIRNSFRYASRRDWPELAKDLKPIYTAPTEAAALERLAEFAGRWADGVLTIRVPTTVADWPRVDHRRVTQVRRRSPQPHTRLRRRSPARPVPPGRQGPAPGRRRSQRRQRHLAPGAATRRPIPIPARCSWGCRR